MSFKEALFEVSNTRRSGFWEGRAMASNCWAALLYLVFGCVALGYALFSPAGTLEAQPED